MLEPAVAAAGAQSADALAAAHRRAPARVGELERRLRDGAAPACRSPADLAELAPSGVAGRPRSSRSPRDFDSMDELKACAQGRPRRPGRRASSRSALDEDEPQLFVTVSDDLVARGRRCRRPGPRRRRGHRRQGRRPARDGAGRGTRRDGAADAALDAMPRDRLAARPDARTWRPLAPVPGTRPGRRRSATCTALDIGTEYVKALVFEIERGPATVTGVGRQRQGLSHMQSGTVADIAAVVANCRAALDEAEAMAGFRPTRSSSASRASW